MRMPVLALFAVAGILAPVVRADEPAIVAQARAYLGPEGALAGIQTLHFTGKYVQTNPDFPNDRTKDTSRTVDIFFEKPWRERIVVRAAGKVLETALDGYDGWQRATDPADPTATRLVLLGAEVTENLRADTWENLYFFRGLTAVGGRVEDDGAATVDGVACDKVAFIHSPSIIYYRYFDQATGRLVVTETAAGVTIRETGEILAGGIRFPGVIITRQKTQGGKEAVSTYSFDKIAVNEALPDSYFSVPLSALSP